MKAGRLAPRDLAAAGLEGAEPLVDLHCERPGSLLGRQLHAQAPLQVHARVGDIGQDFGQPLGSEAPPGSQP